MRGAEGQGTAGQGTGGGTRGALTSVMPVPDTVLSEGHRLPSCVGKEKRGQGESAARGG